MGIFDFFRKKQETRKKALEIKELDNYISNLKIENKEKEANLSDTIKQTLSRFVIELTKKNNVLKTIDLNQRKADPRAKFIIRENLYHYIDNLEKLIKQLTELDSANLVDLIKDIDSLFIDFEGKSRLNFEKATFLIGRELGDVKDLINNFVQNLKKLLNENKSFLDSIDIIKLIELKLGDLDEVEKLMQEIDKKKNENTLNINEIQGNIASIQIEIEKIKSSNTYIQEIAREADIEVKTEELEKEVYQLKEMIDFKKLANIYHYDSKKMAIINEYKFNFLKTFERDKLLSLIPLLNDANITDSHLSKKTNDIMRNEKEIEKIKKSSNKSDSDSLYDLNKKYSKSNSGIESLKQEIQKDEKRKEKIEQKRQEILGEIKQLLAKIDVELMIN